ncbi:hypothetical protein [Leptothermofonsia sp. ETS-13]|uniref:hypothetical protein n=1 Tax=Leptothermofonsia sp. ETS-13 TaxID=3035696 RepID=UPI003BA3819D
MIVPTLSFLFVALDIIIVVKQVAIINWQIIGKDEVGGAALSTPKIILNLIAPGYLV